jgi:hypothetical protein
MGLVNKFVTFQQQRLWREKKKCELERAGDNYTSEGTFTAFIYLFFYRRDFYTA